MTQGITVAVDFDQTITKDISYDPYPDIGEEIPDLEMIRWINDQAQYNEIIVYTARGEELREATQNWLDHNGVNYDKIVMDKLDADMYIDDKAVRPDEAKTSQSTSQIKQIQ